MSAPQKGMALAKEAQDLTERMETGVITAGVDDTSTVQGGARAVQFPKKFSARSPEDNLMNTKMQLMDDKGMTPFGQVYYDDAAGRWIQRKAAAAEAANFDSY